MSTIPQPTEKSKEITPEEIKRLPHVKFINLTGGEPFIREDLYLSIFLYNLSFSYNV
jgi:molybdenum cofactor biosynthesis enzyme MoaA